MESALFDAIKEKLDPDHFPIDEFNILYNLVRYPNASVEEAVEKVVNLTLKEPTALDDFAFNICALILDISTNTVLTEQANLVEFVSQLQKCSVRNPTTGEQVRDSEGQRLWQDLSTFGILVTDFWNFDHRKSHSQAEIIKWENKNAFLAQLTAAAEVDYDDTKSLHPLDFANFSLFTFYDAFDSYRDYQKGKQSKTAVRAASLWIKIAAYRLWSHCENQRPFDYYDECEERGFDIEQWNHWKQSLIAALDAPFADGETRELIKDALEQISQVEAGR